MLRPSPVRRRRLLAGVRADGDFGAGEAVGQAFHVAPQAIDLLPLRGDRRVEIFDRPLVVRDADFEFVGAGLIGGRLGHGSALMTATVAMLHARP